MDCSTGRSRVVLLSILFGSWVLVAMSFAIKKIEPLCGAHFFGLKFSEFETTPRQDQECDASEAKHPKPFHRISDAGVETASGMGGEGNAQ
jgi:hypothetical protein